MPYKDPENTKAARKRYADKNVKKERTRKRDYMRSVCADPVKSAARNAKQRKWREENPEKARSYRKRGSNVAPMVWGELTFELLYEQQDGRCEGCSGPLLPGPTTHVDHDHTTGKVRGLLCKTCNMGMGLLKDSPDVLRRLAAYLERPR